MSCKAGIPQRKIESIDDTIDYAVFADIINKHFAQPAELLETLAADISSEVKTQFPEIRYFFISIKKMNPALNAQVESSEVIIEKHY